METIWGYLRTEVGCNSCATVFSLWVKDESYVEKNFDKDVFLGFSNKDLLEGHNDEISLDIPGKFSKGIVGQVVSAFVKMID